MDEALKTRRRRIHKKAIIEEFVGSGKDQEGFKVEFISDDIGKFCIFVI